jgi:hypothetical protein
MLLEKFTPLLLQSVILILLIIFTPYVMTFAPYERIYMDGVWSTPWHLDSQYSLRVILIIAGLLGGVFSFLCLMYELKRSDWEINNVLLQASMTLCSLSIGWRSFPYWVNGVYQAHKGNARLADFDPKALMPEIWIGDIWRLGAGLISIFAIAGIPVLFLYTLISFKENKMWKPSIATVLCLAMLTAVQIYSPQYMNWLMD